MNIFFTKEWVNLFAEEEGGVADKFELIDGDKVIAHFFIKREINKLPFANNLNEKYYDITSAYGYDGFYMTLSAMNDIDFVNRFKRDFIMYCYHNNIIAGFVRFHPLLRNQILFSDFYELKEICQCVYIELSQTEEQILENMEKRHRYSIRKAVKDKVIIEVDNILNYMNQFEKLYKETMDRKSASKFYYFSDIFFNKLVEYFSEHLILLIARRGNKLLAISLFISDGENLFYFLSGASKDSYLYCANHLLLYQAALYGKRANMKKLVLGEGLKEGDDLSKFKSGFSKTRLPFYIGSKAYNKEVYESIVKLSKVGKNIDYFPSYRYKFTSCAD